MLITTMNDDFARARGLAYMTTYSKYITDVRDGCGMETGFFGATPRRANARTSRRVLYKSFRRTLKASDVARATDDGVVVETDDDADRRAGERQRRAGMS